MEEDATETEAPEIFRVCREWLREIENVDETKMLSAVEEMRLRFQGLGLKQAETEDVLPSLEEQGVPQLYPKDTNIDYKKELRSLNRELQLHILELADVLVERPSQYAKRIGEISSIFKNLHHLLNSLRPHQARATLIHIMELQIQLRKQAVEDIKRRREEAQRLLNDALATLNGQ